MYIYNVCLTLNFYSEILCLEYIEESQEPSKRTTTPYMTKYERARVLGTRALQIRYFITNSHLNYMYIGF